MAFFHLLDQLRQQQRPIRLASSVDGQRRASSYTPLVNDPVARDAGQSDPTPEEIQQRIAEIHAGVVYCQHGIAQRRREEAGEPVELAVVPHVRQCRKPPAEAGAD